MVVLILTTFLVRLTKHFANQGEQKSNVDFNTHYTMFSWDIFQWLIKVFRFGCAVYIHSIWFGLEDLELKCFSRICECNDERAVCVKVERKTSGKKGYWRQVWPIWPIRRPRTKNCSSKTSETWHRLNWDEYRPPPLDTRRWHLKHHMFSFFLFIFLCSYLGTAQTENVCRPLLDTRRWCFLCCQLARLNPSRRAFCTKRPSFGSLPEKWSF